MWEKIKKVLNKEGGKCIIIENGEPSYLISRLDDNKEAETERANRDVDEWKMQRDAAVADAVSTESEEQEKAEEEIKIENLPF